MYMNEMNQEDYFFIQELQLKTPNQLKSIAHIEILSDTTRFSVLESIFSIINAESPDSNGLTHLHSAIMKGKVDVVRFLLNKGINPFYKYENDNPGKIPAPIITAVSTGNLEILEILLEHKDSKAYLEENIEPLCSSIKNNHVEIFKRLFNYTKNVNATCENGQSPLFYASTVRDPEFAIMLLERGANVHLTNFLKNTPLHMAVQHNNIKIVQILLDHGANLYSKNIFGVTPIDSARHYKRILNLLKERINKKSI